MTAGSGVTPGSGVGFLVASSVKNWTGEQNGRTIHSSNRLMRKIDLQIQLEMLRLGLVPHVHFSAFEESFHTLSVDEKRKAARKFRKQWRKLVKKFPKTFGEEGDEPLSDSHLRPDYIMRQRRRMHVYRCLRSDIINRTKKGDVK